MQCLVSNRSTERIDVTAAQARSALVACTATLRGEHRVRAVQARDKVYLCIGSAGGRKSNGGRLGQEAKHGWRMHSQYCGAATTALVARAPTGRAYRAQSGLAWASTSELCLLQTDSTAAGRHSRLSKPQPCSGSTICTPARPLVAGDGRAARVGAVYLFHVLPHRDSVTKACCKRPGRLTPHVCAKQEVLRQARIVRLQIPVILLDPDAVPLFASHVRVKSSALQLQVETGVSKLPAERRHSPNYLRHDSRYPPRPHSTPNPRSATAIVVRSRAVELACI